MCRCRGKRGEMLDNERLMSFLKEKGIPHIELNDLCGLVANDRTLLKEVFSGDVDSLLAACSERSLRLLLSFAGIESGPGSVRVIDRFANDFDQITGEICDFALNADMTPAEIICHESKEGWNSWYPLIDNERCNGCGQCAEFCLFGVYTKNEDGVQVMHPEGCKDQCPACARLCPRAAIVFPKFAEGGAIGGATVIDELAESARIKNDLEVIAGNDIYRTLQQRRVQRSALLRDSVIKKAEDERDRALAEAKRRDEI